MFHRVIFLDIDGVLNTPNFRVMRVHFHVMDPENVARIRHVVEVTKAVLVITSTWRLNLDWEKDVRRAFSAAGWEDPPIVGRTPSGRSRGLEIADWLEKNQVEDFVIIDDDIFDMIPNHQPHIIKCDNETGLSEENKKVIEERWR